MSDQSNAAMQRLGFALVLVPWVVANPGATVESISEWFDVPAEQVRDTVRMLPLVGVPGDSAAYDPGNLFDIDYDDFELNDRVTITNSVGLNHVQRFSTAELAGLSAALNYLAALLPDERRAAATRLAARLGGGTVTARSEGRFAETIALLRACGADRGAVEFDYTSASGHRSHRTVTVERVRMTQGIWYLSGVDGVDSTGLPRRRTFRLDRMAAVARSARPPIAADHGQSTSASVDTVSRDDEAEPITVTLEVQAEAAGVLMAFGERLTDDVSWPVRRLVRVASVPALVRHVSSLPGRVRILAPASVREAVADHARRALAASVDAELASSDESPDE
ncbi:helix-turn-helix transcriptional regulator [Pseudoclavibacter sp. CFCC 11306]|uniref:helix-turn-helix transcriptional regulator n=1 Tax=Pseudoclavibacter sp. CFCC 11306 TaxID=1564493 RepID=UPI00130128B8|nr:WYL domain-containing protein [Pseudoclavibacter sp. CFCC 11306]KAB1658328.1 WYL domain-containing protein [Pseudoclavibacter sp. CFCC 11306]